MKRIIAVVFLLCLLPSAAYAHSGRTDGNGGHTNHSTGEYHYHHGYPAHDHYDMDGDGDVDCPYDFDDKTGENSGSSAERTSKIFLPSPPPSANPKATRKAFDWEKMALYASCVGFVLSVSIPIVYNLCKKHGHADNEDTRD